MSLIEFQQHTKAKASEINCNFNLVNDKIKEMSHFKQVYTPYVYSESLLHIDFEIKLRYNGGYIQKSTDNGSNWSNIQATAGTITNFDYNASNTNYIVAYSSTEGWYSIDGGVSFTEFTLFTGFDSYIYKIMDDGTLVVGYSEGDGANTSWGVSISVNDGSTWTQKLYITDTNNIINSTSCEVLNDNIIAFSVRTGDTNEGFSYLSNDLGDTWNSDTDANLSAIDYEVGYIDSNNYYLQGIIKDIGSSIFYAQCYNLAGAGETVNFGETVSNITLFHSLAQDYGIYTYVDSRSLTTVQPLTLTSTDGTEYITGCFNTGLKFIGKSYAGNYLYGTRYGDTYYKKETFQI